MVMKKEDNTSKIHEHLNKSSCYEKLVKNTLNIIMKNMFFFLNKSCLDEYTKRELVPKCTLIPRIYGLPKIHKENTPLKAIVNTCWGSSLSSSL